MSSSTLRFCGELRRNHGAIGSCWRRLTTGRQALLVFAHLRMGHTYAQFAVGITTGYGYVAEGVDLLADLDPTPADVVRTASTKAFVLLEAEPGRGDGPTGR